MPQQSKPETSQQPALTTLFDGVLCLFSALSLGFLIGLTTKFYHNGTAGDKEAVQIASMLGFVAFAQACEFADKVWRLCCTPVMKAGPDKAKKTQRRDDMTIAIPCPCLDEYGECFADDEQSPDDAITDSGERVCDGKDDDLPIWWKRRSELPLQAVNRGTGELRVETAHLYPSVAMIEDADPTPRASKLNAGSPWSGTVDAGGYDADCDEESRCAGQGRPSWLLVDECDGDGMFLWEEA